jgi:hypothetical protein
VPKTIYVPTGEVRHPTLGEFFQHYNYDHFTPDVECRTVFKAINDAIVVRCIVRDLPIDAEIYIPVLINA